MKYITTLILLFFSLQINANTITSTCDFVFDTEDGIVNDYPAGCASNIKSFYKERDLDFDIFEYVDGIQTKLCPNEYVIWERQFSLLAISYRKFGDYTASYQKRLICVDSTK